jgi:replication-associated recombination protein RarA
MGDLFGAVGLERDALARPLADALRPRRIGEVVGQVISSARRGR